MKLSKLTKLLGSLYYLRYLVQGVAGAVEHEAVLRSKDYRTIIDIGANRGQFSLAARRCCRYADIYAFEPLPGPGKVFRRVFANDPKTVLFEAAIGAVARTAHIHISRRDDSSSLLPISDKQAEIFPGTEELELAEVEVSRIETFIGPDKMVAPALVKIDVQGAEAEVLAGCEAILSRCDSAYVECSFIELYEGQQLASDIVAGLHARGFDLAGVYNTFYDSAGQAVQADFLFERQNNNA